MTASTHTGPYPGLRPFDSEELDIFFGRERQTDELLARLQKHRLLAVVGPSGCGKSSLVRAGMIPALQSGFMIDTGSNWHVAKMRPGEHPLLSLAEKLLTPALLGGQRGDSAESVLYLKAALKRGPLSLIEILRESTLCRGANFLLLVDQFEELFRFRRHGNVDEAEAFVAMLLATAAQRELPIYIVITMRSDFLGDCTLFHGLPEAINDCQYLTPRLTREECASAVTGPAQVFGGAADPKLLNRLLNDFGPDPDQLPLLQHALMRMWEQKTAQAAESNILTIEDYDRIGGLQQSLSKHGDEVFAKLSAEQRRVAEIMLRRLVDLSSGKRDMRVSARVAEIAEIAAVPSDVVVKVIEVFRDRTCSFVTPPDGTLEADTLIDIGHESLIRKWTTFSAWVKDEAEAVNTYRRLRETALLWKQKKAALWRTPDLEFALAWKAKFNPNEPWAARYGELGDLTIALAFLDASEAQQRTEQAREQAMHARQLRRIVRWAISGLAIVSVSLAGLLGYLYLYQWDYARYFGSFVKQNGMPIGIGELSRSDASHRRVSLKIVKQGRLGNVLRIEAVDARGRPTTQHGIGTYLEYAVDGWFKVPDQVATWEFTYDPDGQVAAETALNSLDSDARKVIWRFVHLPAETKANESIEVRRGYFVGPNGLPRVRGDDKLEQRTIVEIHYNAAGMEDRVLYLNRANRPTKAKDGAYGQKLVYDTSDPYKIVEIISLGPDQQPMIDEFGNSGLRVAWDRFGNIVELHSFDVQGQPIALQGAGWVIEKRKTDDFGRVTEDSFFSQDQRKILNKYTDYHRFERSYDPNGNVLSERYFDTNEQPTTDKILCHGYAWTYDDRDRLSTETCFGVDGKPKPRRDHYAMKKFAYDSHDCLVETRYLDVDGNPTFITDDNNNKGTPRPNDGYAGSLERRDLQGRVVETKYIDLEGRPKLSRYGYALVKYEYDENGNTASRSYFGLNGEPVLHRVYRYARSVQRYDSYGNNVRTEYFGARGERVIARGTDQQYSGWSTTFDSDGRPLVVRNLDTNDRPIIGTDQTAGSRFEYDEAGNNIRTAYFGKLDQPIENSSGVARVDQEYDPYGQVTRVRYFDRFGKRTTSRTMKASGWSYVYDEARRISQSIYLNEADEPVTSNRGYARMEWKYNKHGQKTHELYFDADSRPIPINNSIGAQFVFDEVGNETQRIFLGNSREKSKKIASDTITRIESEWDAHGNLLTQAYYGADNELAVISGVDCARYVVEYDVSRLATADSCYGTDGKLIERRAPGGYKKRVYTYDARGFMIEIRFFGDNDQPARFWGDTVGDGQFMTRNRFDEFGNVVEQTFFDDKGQRMRGYSNQAEQCFRWTATYNYAGNMQTEKGECHQE